MFGRFFKWCAAPQGGGEADNAADVADRHKGMREKCGEDNAQPSVSEPADRGAHQPPETSVPVDESMDGSNGNPHPPSKIAGYFGAENRQNYMDVALSHDANVSEDALANKPKKKKFIINNIEEKRPLVVGRRPIELTFIGLERAADVLFVERAGWDKIMAHIGWGERRTSNVVEQGGILLGTASIDEKTGDAFTVVSGCIPATGVNSNAAYLSIDHTAWGRMQADLDRLDVGDQVQIVGWYHTHPNGLDVFMSQTDMVTQTTFFPEEWHFSLVLNPQRKKARAYRGKAAIPCKVIVLPRV